MGAFYGLSEPKCALCNKKTYGAKFCSLEHFKKYENNKTKYSRIKIIKEYKEERKELIKSIKEEQKTILENIENGRVLHGRGFEKRARRICKGF